MRDEKYRNSSLIPHPSSLLVVRLSAFGDVIHTIPAVVALRDHFDISWVVRPAYRELVEIVAKVRAVRPELRAIRTFPDFAVDFQGLMKSAVLARISGAKERFGFATEFIREKPAAWLMNRRVRIDPATHVIDWNLQLARAVFPEVVQPNVDFAPYAADEPRGFAGRIVLIPGAGKPQKLWPVQCFRELAHRIGRRALAVWGPGEKEIAEATGAEVAPPTSLRELARILRDSSLVIGSDTGPLHLAAALGTRVIGLYGPTNPARNGPYGQIKNCVETFSTTKTMHDITVDAVQRRIEEIE
jgi:lipopolysaccharide heptosyltransferase I